MKKISELSDSYSVLGFLMSGTPVSQVILALIVSILMAPLIFIVVNIQSSVDTGRETERKPAYVFLDENFKQNLFFKIDCFITAIDKK